MGQETTESESGREASLVQRAQAGDRAAFDLLAAGCRPTLRALAFIRTSDRADAEDLVQEVLVRAWRKLPTLQDPASFLSWMRAILAHACRDWHRRAPPHTQTLDDHSSLPASGLSPLDVLLARERQRELRRALVRIPEANRLALMMHVWDGSSYEDIAASAGVPVTTVEGRIYRAKRQMRRLLKDQGAAFLDEPHSVSLPKKSALPDLAQRSLMMTPKTTLAAPDAAQPLALVLFSYQFATLIEAGVSIVRSLLLLEQMSTPYGQAASRLREQVERGEVPYRNDLSKAMAERPDLFPGFYIGMVRAGEDGEMLEETLRRAADLMTKEWKLARTSRQGQEPLFLLNPAGRVRPEDWSALSAYQQAVTLTLFCETFALLCRSGVPILRTLETLSALLPTRQREKLMAARERVRLGDRLQLEELGILPPFAVELVNRGEENGTLDLTLERAADIFEHELECRTLAMTRG